MTTPPEPGEPSATAAAAAATSEAAAATSAAAAKTEDAAAATIDAAAAEVHDANAEGSAAIAEAASLAAHLSDARELLGAGLIVELVGEVRALAKAVGELSLTWGKRFEENETERRRNRLVIILGATLAMVIAGFLFQLNSVARTNQTNGEILVACTVPFASLPPEQQTLTTGELRCFERGQAATAGAVTAIVHCTRLALTATPAEVDACIIDELTPGTTP